MEAMFTDKTDTATNVFFKQRSWLGAGDKKAGDNRRGEEQRKKTILGGTKRIKCKKYREIKGKKEEAFNVKGRKGTLTVEGRRRILWRVAALD